MELKEKNFEQDIESFLISPDGGYEKGDLSTYDAAHAVDMKKLVSFIEKTQEKVWERYKKAHSDNPEYELRKLFVNQVNQNGILHVLKNGLSDTKLYGTKLQVAHLKRPEAGINPELAEKYNANILTCTRQFKYSTENNNSIDMVLSLNGIPIVAIELKNQLTGQSVDNGKYQWMYDRDPKETLFVPDRRVLIFFVADLYQVMMATTLAGKNTVFLPFNQGSGGAGRVGGKGNPVTEEGYITAYFWETVLQKDRLLDILQKYVYVTKEKGKSKVVFPRYHQLDVVTKVLADVRSNGSGKNYLINHSAGSGKSNSIAWLAYRLASLHNENDESIFRSVIVITDRRVLDKQIQGTIMSIDHMPGLVVPIDSSKTSKDLLEAINEGKKIIITTLQKFPIIYKNINGKEGRNFAIIVDEAHSSQTGSSAANLKAGLADVTEALKEYEEIESQIEQSTKDNSEIDAQIVNELLAHGQHKNLSFFAFTATPKPRTLEIFGTRDPESGMFLPFHVYSMRQAIEEEFILDVLKNYTTYKNYYKIVKATPENPEVPESPAKKAVRRFQSFHPYVLRQKTEVMIEHFLNVTKNKINGKAKAMVVTASRLHAVRYFQEFKKYIEEKGYDLDVLVAFSGGVNFEGKEFTEANLNEIPESQTREAFGGDEFHILIVAEKYQTGFDEPLLHTMFVDKKLDGIKAVQTLSRLNRIYPPFKIDTFVLDFVNEAEDIQEAFKPFYETTALKTNVDPNLVYAAKDDVDKYYMFNQDEVDKFCNIFFKSGKQSDKDMGKISAILKPVIDRYNNATPDTRFEFKKTLKGFVDFYTYIVQMSRLFDKELHKVYTFSNYLYRVIPYDQREKIDLDKQLKLEFSKLNQTFVGSIELQPAEEPLEPPAPPKVKPPDRKSELLEEIIRKINEAYKGKFSEADRVMVETLFSRCDAENNKKLKKYAKENDAEMFLNAVFKKEFSDIAQQCYEEQMDAFSKLFENQEFYNEVMLEMGREIHKKLRS